MMSGRLKKALSSVPATNPSCTDKVSQLTASPLRFHSLVSAGTTAEPLNQRDMPSNSAIASSASIRQRSLEPSLDEEVGFRKREIVAQRPGRHLHKEVCDYAAPQCGKPAAFRLVERTLFCEA